ncbi:hypothetical protein Q644_09840 [Brucella intermedia 229E]|uniref:Uncharacterized protein n=1 Tax=Brucella intermedia 229E TaxID=1337887 RepID=U4VAB8_9HYPH|nr:hypothetical protein Q644_09840 [Brucella intermedia 229E]
MSETASSFAISVTFACDLGGAFLIGGRGGRRKGIEHFAKRACPAPSEDWTPFGDVIGHVAGGLKHPCPTQTMRAENNSADCFGMPETYGGCAVGEIE